MLEPAALMRGDDATDCAADPDAADPAAADPTRCERRVASELRRRAQSIPPAVKYDRKMSTCAQLSSTARDASPSLTNSCAAPCSP